MQIKNLTPHPIVIFSDDGEGDGCYTTETIPPCGQVARCAEKSVPVVVDGFPYPAVVKSYGEVEGLPAPVPWTLYFVSSIVAAAARDRKDLVTPGKLVRDKSGNVIGIESFAFPNGTPEFKREEFNAWDPCHGDGFRKETIQKDSELVRLETLLREAENSSHRNPRRVHAIEAAIDRWYDERGFKRW